MVVYHEGHKGEKKPHFHLKLPPINNLKIKGKEYCTDTRMKHEIMRLWYKTNGWSLMKGDNWWVEIYDDGQPLNNYLFHESDWKDGSTKHIDSVVFI